MAHDRLCKPATALESSSSAKPRDFVYTNPACHGTTQVAAHFAGLNVSEEQFYDPDVVALVPMGFCYPGSAPSGDKPPRPECAPLWHEPLLNELSKHRLDIIIGTYAQKRYIPDRKKTLTETVANWAAYLPTKVVLPHPSRRNQPWLTKNPWFETETIPAVQLEVPRCDGRVGCG